MDYEFMRAGARQVVSLEKRAGRLVIRLGETLLEAEVETLADGTVSFLTGEGSHLAHLGRGGSRILVSIGGERVSLELPGREAVRPGRPEELGQGGIFLVRAPMPGRVIKLGVTEGQAVRKSQTLLIVEAMKMENEIKSPQEAKVRRLFVTAGELVDADKPLVELEPSS